MRSMETTLVIMVFLLKGLWETEATSVTGVVGGKVTITCSHSYAIGNVKYFCKGDCRDEDVLITSRAGSNKRYSITDKGNTFIVTISDLRESDSGTYWCAIERAGVDTYNKVTVTVDAKGGNQSSNLFANISTSKKLVYIGAGLGVMVLALAIVLLIFFRYRNRDVGSSSGKDDNTVYATPSTQKGDAHHDTSSSPANEDPETDVRISSSISLSSDQHHDTGGDHTDNIYSNMAVSSEPQIQSDGLFYSTVSFNKHTDCSSVTPPAATATYSSLKHTSPEESAIYCNTDTF